MVSTVTSVTTTAVSTAATAAGFGLIATVTLIVLLIAKELAGAASENSSAPEFTLTGVLDRVLNVAILPLSMVFVSVVLVKISDIL